MKLQTLLVFFIFGVFSLQAQEANFEIHKTSQPTEIHESKQVKTDGLVQPYLNDFIKYCKKYNIKFHDKLLNLKK